MGAVSCKVTHLHISFKTTMIRLSYLIRLHHSVSDVTFDYCSDRVCMRIQQQIQLLPLLVSSDCNSKGGFDDDDDHDDDHDDHDHDHDFDVVLLALLLMLH